MDSPRRQVSEHMERVLIDGLPRMGTTTLTKLLTLHPDIRGVVEPFHPRRYGGVHHKRAIDAGSPTSFEFAWSRWNLIKHVWESGWMWPFYRPELQVELWRSATVVIAVTRRNLLRRYVSAELSRFLQFWIGTRQEFERRLATVSLLSFDVSRALRSMRRDREAMEWRSLTLTAQRANVISIVYEDFYRSPIGDQVELIRDIHRAMQVEPLKEEWLKRAALEPLNISRYRWSSIEVYQSIPNWRELDHASAEAGFGSFFGE